MIRSWLVILLIYVSSLNIFSATTGKVLVVSSYGTDYKWSNDIIDSISLLLNNAYPSIEFNREFLSSESLETSEMWKGKMNVLLSSYKKKKPLAIILVSDEAWMAYRDANTEFLKDVPLILCAVKPHSISIDNYLHKINKLQLSDFTPTVDVMKKYNATGILREMNIPGYLSLIDNLIVGLNRFVFITDSRFYGIYTHLLLQKEVKARYPHIPVEYIDGRFVSTDSLFVRLSHVSSRAGVLLTSWLTGEYGFEYSKDYVYSQMENKLITPIFITNDIGLDKEYFLGGYFNDASYWGKRAGKILLTVLQGKSPREINTVIRHDEQCNIAWKVFNHYHLDMNKLPAKTRFFNAPEPFWDTYKSYIIVVAIVLFIFVIFYIYTFWSNIKLQRTQRLLLRSVDETKSANKKLEETQEELMIALHKAEESDRLKSAFLANISHEIRTPLNAIVGFSGVLDEVESKKERSEYMKLIQRNSDLLLRLVSDILDLARIEAGSLELIFNENDALEICSNVVYSLQKKCKEGVQLYLSESVTPMSLYTDSNRLIQVLINLVNNAIKFTKKGNIEIGYFSYNEEWIEFYVQDTGIGISKEKLNVIFDRFVKLDECVEGTGLGLSICKMIVEALGGEIGVESEEGVGSRFWVRIKKRQE